MDRRTFVQLASFSALSLAAAPVLTACSKPNNASSSNDGNTSNDQDADNTSAEQPKGETKPTAPHLTPSKAFGQPSTWIRSATPSDTAEISEFLVFDRDGKVTSYRGNGATYASLAGKDADGVIQFAKDQDKNYFDAKKSTNVSNYRALESQSRSSGANMQAQQYAQSAAMWEMDSYAAPVSFPFSLHVKTDQSGQTTLNESLNYSYYVLQDDGDQTNKADAVRSVLASDSNQHTAGGSTYMGFGTDNGEGLWSVINYQVDGIALDAPDTDGVVKD